MTDRAYIPPLRFHSLTNLYDAVLAWTMREKRFKRRLVVQANIHPGLRVLDLGCGTGTLTYYLWRWVRGSQAARLKGPWPS